LEKCFNKIKNNLKVNPRYGGKPYFLWSKFIIRDFCMWQRAESKEQRAESREHGTEGVEIEKNSSSKEKNF